MPATCRWNPRMHSECRKYSWHSRLADSTGAGAL